MRIRLALAGAVLLPAVLASCAERGVVEPALTPQGTVAAAAVDIVINEIMADPSAVTDDNGEWLELHNRGTAALNLQGWSLASAIDAGYTISTTLSLAAGGYAVLARNGTKSKNGGVTVQRAYGSALTLANSTDWLVLRDASGATIDSVQWTSMPSGAARGVKDPTQDNASVGGANWQTQTTAYGRGDKGTPGARNDGFTTAPGAIATVAVTPATASVAVGSTQQFTATARDANGTIVTATFTWSSASPATATVDASGLATGGAAGGAQIRATAPNGIFGEAALTVTGGGGGSASELVVRVLDIGQGDANYITNGTSKVFIDGGPDTTAFRQHLDALGVSNTTIDVVILSHEHQDHHSGLRELFKTNRGLTVRYVFENKNVYTNTALGQLRDSINARVARGELIYRDSDDPCGNGASICTITMNGGAKLHVLRPNPNGSTANNRSTPVKLVGPDSASFSMWFAGDAEHEAIQWFDDTNYDLTPGMKVNVLKGNHHGSCNGIRSRYFDLLNPDWVTFSVGASNTYGHVHNQTKDLVSGRAKPWYRTDQNGTITFRTPGSAGGGYTISVQRGSSSLNGGTDATSGQSACSAL